MESVGELAERGAAPNGQIGYGIIARKYGIKLPELWEQPSPSGVIDLVLKMSYETRSH